MGTLLVITSVVLIVVLAGGLLALVPKWSRKGDQQQPRLLELTLIGLVAVAALVLVIWLLPVALAQGNYAKDADRIKAQSDARGNVVALVVALGLLGGLGYTARTYRLSQQTYELNRAGQITDRYAKSVEQLGDAKIEVRLGGIYALERLMRESPVDQAAIVETLAAFVRHHVPHRSWPDLPARGAHGAASKPSADVQAVLAVLGRREPTPGSLAIDLQATDLTGALLPEAALANVLFVGANLTHADLHQADVTVANLQEAILTGANLAGATLTGANLTGATLTGATLTEGALSEEQFASARGTEEIKWIPRRQEAG